MKRALQGVARLREGKRFPFSVHLFLPVVVSSPDCRRRPSPLRPGPPARFFSSHVGCPSAISTSCRCATLHVNSSEGMPRVPDPAPMCLLATTRGTLFSICGATRQVPGLLTDFPCALTLQSAQLESGLLINLVSPSSANPLTPPVHSKATASQFSLQSLAITFAQSTLSLIQQTIQ